MKLIEYIKLHPPKSIKGLISRIITIILNKYQPAYFSIYTYKVNQELAGYCLMRGRWLWKLWIKPEHRRKGLGSKLIPNHANFVISNQKALQFYEKQGFVLQDKHHLIMTRSDKT